MSRATRLAGLVLSALLATGATQGVPFRASTDLVVIYATATSDNGTLVSNLTREDFTVLDAGTEQPIATFTSDPQPFSVVLMLDYSESMASYKNLMAKAAREFIARLLPGDRARIGAFSVHTPTRAVRVILGPAGFTSDPAELTRALDEQMAVMGPGVSPVWPAADLSVDALAGESQRRVILFFSDGRDASVTRGQLGFETGGRRWTEVTRLSDVASRVDQHEVMFYSLAYSAPLMAEPPDTIDRRIVPGVPPLRPPRRIVLPPNPGLKMLADRSGGGYYELDPDKDFAATFAHIADELHSQYLIGFVPVVRDGKTHPITVRINRPGIKVRARTSYLAPG